MPVKKKYFRAKKKPLKNAYFRNISVNQKKKIIRKKKFYQKYHIYKNHF